MSLTTRRLYSTKGKISDRYYNYFSLPHITVQSGGNKGRAVITKQKISQGTIVHKAQPYATVVHIEKLDQYCSICHKPLHSNNLYPGESTLNVYGSPKCRDYWENNKVIIKPFERFASWVYNQRTQMLGYKYSTDDEFWCSGLMNGLFDNMHLIMKILMRRWSEMNSERFDFGCFEQAKVQTHLKWSDVEQLIHNTQFIPKNRLYEINQSLELIMQFFDNKRMLLPQSEMVALASRIDCNAFFICQNENTEGNAEKKSDSGIGIFPSASYFNHDCFPNCTFSLDDELNLSVITNRDTERGEELTICYDLSLHEFKSIKDKRERCKNRMKANYYFDCNCT